MKKTILSVLFLIAATAVFAQKDMSFVVEGPEQSYNQIRVVNETSLENFNCRVVILNDDKTVKEVYGDYELKEKGDSDSNTKGTKDNRVQKGTQLAVKFPKNFQHELSFYVEYRDYPLFDVIVIHLADKDGGYGEY